MLHNDGAFAAWSRFGTDDAAAAVSLSARIWDDGPRIGQHPHRYAPAIGAHAMWNGWPTDERTACYRRLLAAINGTAPRRRAFGLEFRA